MISYVINGVLVTILVVLVIARIAADRLVGHHHAQKCDFFRKFPVQPGDIVFLGDSITDGARWHELFPGLPVKNRGINADTVSGVLDRLDDVLDGKPSAIFILIGTNDLPFPLLHSDKNILRTYAALLERCKTQAPETQIFVQSVLPRARRWSQRIRRLNACLEQLAANYGCTYIDLFPHFAAPDGQIRPEISNDRLHLMGSGYEIWVTLLTPYIEKLDLQPVSHNPTTSSR